MPAAKRSISSRVTIQNPRPRKYASAAERQKALRERFPTLCVRVEQEQADFMKRIADEQGRTLQDVHLAFIKYANGRGNLWLTQGLKGFAPLPRFEEPPKENPMKRKPTPAQIAARERFAEMARSGAFKKKVAKRNPVGNVANLKKRYNTLLTTIAGLRDDQKRRAVGLPDELEGYTDAEIKKLISMYQAKASDLREAINMYQRNPAKKTVSQKISQLSREGYPQKQAVAIALSEERAGKVSRNPRASNPIVLVTDRKPSKRKANPVKPKRQRMLNISWMTAGGQRDMKSVPIDFVFTHYVGNVAERFFVRTENGQLIVSEYSTGGRIGQVPYTMRAAALNDRDAAKLYVGEMLSRIGAERFKAVVKKFDPIN